MGQALLISAATGVGKSSLMVQLCVALVMMICFCGIISKRRLKVLYLQSENNDGDFREALKGSVLWAAAALAMTEDEVWSVVESSFRSKALRRVRRSGNKYDAPPAGVEFANQLTDHYMEFRADVIAIDPTTSYFEGDISNDEDMREFFYGAMTAWHADNPTPAVIWAHHFGQRASTNKQSGKSGADWSESAYAQKGSTTLIDWFRASINITETNVPGTFKFYFAKRGGRVQERTWYITQNPAHRAMQLMSWTCSPLAPVLPAAPEAPKLTAKQRAQRLQAEQAAKNAHAKVVTIIDRLEEGPMSKAEYCKQVMELDACSRAQSYRMFDELVKSRSLVPAPENLWRKSPEEGAF
jgi:hypothetical protein